MDEGSGHLADGTLERRLERLRAHLTPATVESAMDMLLQQGEDPGGGVGVFRLVTALLGDPVVGDTEIVRAYERLRPALRSALEELPEFYFFEGD